VRDGKSKSRRLRRGREASRRKGRSLASGFPGCCRLGTRVIVADTRPSFAQNPLMPSQDKLAGFAARVKPHLTGDDKGEAQLFLEHLFQACGRAGLKEAEATLDNRPASGFNRQVTRS
jgi:hypothetical protein